MCKEVSGQKSNMQNRFFTKMMLVLLLSFLFTGLLAVQSYAAGSEVVSNAAPNAKDKAQDKEKAESTAGPIIFPDAPKNTPYKLVAKLPFKQPTSRHSYADKHEDQYAAYWPAAHPEGLNNGVVVFIHGGCWLSAFDMSHSYAFATGLAQAGYHVWSIEYRRAGNGGEWPVALEDVVLGLNKIEVLSNLGIDLTQVSILGHSAGGHLAAMLGAQLDDVLPAAIKQANVIGLAAILDVVDYANGSNSCQTATPSFMSGTPEQQVAAYYLAGPKNFAMTSERLGKFQLLQGKADTIVPTSQAHHQNAASTKIAELGHFDWIHPGSDAFKQLLLLLKDNDERKLKTK